MTNKIKPTGKPAAKRGRGRPEWEPTPTQRRQVAIWAGAGMRHEDMASALGISTPTLRKHCATELSTGANQRRAEVLESLFRQAKKGSVTAAKAYLAASPEFVVPPGAGDELPSGAPAPAAGSAAAPPPLAKPLGKKEQAARDATSAQDGTPWAGVLPTHDAPGTPQ